MWIASKFGWFSIVQKEPGEFHVRARVKQDLQNLLDAMPLANAVIETWPGADYRYRIIIGGDDLRVVMNCLALQLDYSNFKSKIAQTPDQREKLPEYHTIWATMAGLQK